MAGFIGHQYVGDMRSALLVDACASCFVTDYFNHFLGARKLSSLDGLFSRAHNFPCRIHGMSPTQRQGRGASKHLRVVLHRGGRHLSIFFSCRSTFGRLWSLPRLYATRFRQFSQSHYYFQLFRRLVSRLRSFSQLQTLPKSKLRRLLISVDHPFYFERRLNSSIIK